ncbi:MAG TPA: DMT family transporter [Burkholderiales bacterium]|nr:DMT family transporter [Burkholderiales bacterium]
MELTLPVTFAVLGAALLHASWNALIKAGRDPLLDTALVALGGSVMALPLTLLVEAPARASWPYILGTVTVHIGYYTALAAAYRVGDLSHIYPIMRGGAPLLVALASGFFFGETLSASAWLGVLLISCGVLSLAFASRSKHHVAGKNPAAATLWALAGAAVIAVYTLIDAAGARASGGAERYVVWLFVFLGLPFGLTVLVAKRRALLAHARRYWWVGVAGATLSGLSYGIALWAMTRAPVALVAALRETSVIFAALIGALLLKEGRLRERMFGAAAVLAGLVVLKL